MPIFVPAALLDSAVSLEKAVIGYRPGRSRSKTACPLASVSAGAGRWICAFVATVTPSDSKTWTVIRPTCRSAGAVRLTVRIVAWSGKMPDWEAENEVPRAAPDALRVKAPGMTPGNSKLPSGPVVTLRGTVSLPSWLRVIVAPGTGATWPSWKTCPRRVPSASSTICKSSTWPVYDRVAAAEPTRPVTGSVAMSRYVPSARPRASNSPSGPVVTYATPAIATRAPAMGAASSRRTKRPRRQPVAPRVMVPVRT